MANMSKGNAFLSITGIVFRESESEMKSGWERSDFGRSETMRSEERRVGKECHRECISRWSPCH
jgi:hypothetical protein